MARANIADLPDGGVATRRTVAHGLFAVVCRLGRGVAAWAWTPSLVLVVLPILIEFPALISWLDPNPDLWLTGLADHFKGGILPGTPGWIDPSAGLINQALGRLSADEWLHGRVPWWNPYNGVGMPLAAEMTPSSLFLPFILSEHFSQGFLYLKIEMQVLAGLATYALLRELGIARFAALAGAVAFEMNGMFAWWGHAPYAPVPFLPLLVFGIERIRGAVVAGRFRAGGAWVAVAIAGSLYAGFPETAYIDGLLALLWAACRLRGLSARACRSAGLQTALGGIVGLLLAAPAVWPFLEFLTHANVGGHDGWLGLDSLPFAAFPMFVLPYLYGPLFAFSTSDPGNMLSGLMWGKIGGYAGVVLLVLAVVGLVHNRRAPELRYALAGWIIVCLLKTAQVPIVAQVVNLIPGLRAVAFYRYSEASWSFAALVLAVLALDQWRRDGQPARACALTAAITGVLLVLFAVVASAGTRHAIVGHPASARLVFAASVLYAMVATGIVATMLMLRPDARRAAILGAVVALDACVLFAVPILSGAREGKLDLAAVRFLDSNLDLQRFYTLGPIRPNYGAAFRLRSINHMYLPVDSGWVAYVQRHLDPYAHPILFDGSFPRGLPEAPDQASELRTNLAAYEQIGVRYVLVPPGFDPFLTVVRPTRLEGGNTPLPLFDGQAVAGTLAEPLPHDGTITRVNVDIGTYSGAANGALEATLCTRTACATGSADLARAIDNEPFAVALARPLPVAAGDHLRYSIRHVGGANPVAVWLWPAATPSPEPLAGPAGPISGRVPDIAAAYAPEADHPRLAYQGATLDVYELLHAAPYFEVSGGACALVPHGGDAVSTHCDRTAVLVRREMFDAGWRASVNGSAQPVRRTGEIFQEIDLPAGTADVRFRYRPPYIGAAYAAFAAGLLGLLGLVAGRRYTV
jgi:hypothetical protein